MKIIRDQKLIHKAETDLAISSKFSTKNLDFCILEYEKSELVTDPIHELHYLLFIWTGSLAIYGIQNDARLIPVGLAKSGMFIGDVEYVTGNNVLYTEATETTRCLALSIRDYRHLLDNDVLFLRFLSKSLADKVYLRSTTDVPVIQVEEKLLHYIEHQCPNQTLTGIGDATLKLCCSRRQLQRVLAKLCEEGKIKKIKKGTYTIYR